MHLLPGQALPVSQGGTGATHPAAARANLGIQDDPTRVGIVPAFAFNGSPAIGQVYFPAPFPPGTQYAVTVTTVGVNPYQPVRAMVLNKNEYGFLVALDGPPQAILEVNWTARPVN